ncbi:MAG: hypothetical protein QNK37_19890 [Acidobacteriota bacterium]|nr:hypothetical protein [Acidobacteriota bacterium]
MKHIKQFAILLVIATTAFTAVAQDDPAGNYMVNMEFSQASGEEMSLSLPLSMLKTFEPQIQEMLRDIEINDKDVNFRELWEAVKEAGPNDYVEVNSEDADIKVSTTTHHLVVKVHEKRENKKIDVTLPLALIEAFLGEGGFDYTAVVEALIDIEGDLLTIQSDDDEINGRIWITR